jgi:hypothetical protein
MDHVGFEFGQNKLDHIDILKEIELNQVELDRIESDRDLDFKLTF